jgi:hypothetical protein
MPWPKPESGRPRPIADRRAEHAVADPNGGAAGLIVRLGVPSRWLGEHCTTRAFEVWHEIVPLVGW